MRDHFQRRLLEGQRRQEILPPSRGDLERYPLGSGHPLETYHYRSNMDRWTPAIILSIIGAIVVVTLGVLYWDGVVALAEIGLERDLVALERAKVEAAAGWSGEDIAWLVLGIGFIVACVGGGTTVIFKRWGG